MGWPQRGRPIIKVLLIDDDENVAELFGKTLAEAGHDTVVCHGGKEGLASIQSRPPDVVFLDVRMPGMDGIQVLRKIRAVNASLPVILVTGHATPGEIEQARRLGVTEIVEKPYILNEFTSALSRISDRRSS
jgi:CheY-like chemotaxis protein